jgi:hypothetical protein
MIEKNIVLGDEAGDRLRNCTQQQWQASRSSLSPPGAPRVNLFELIEDECVTAGGSLRQWSEARTSSRISEAQELILPAFDCPLAGRANAVSAPSSLSCRKEKENSLSRQNAHWSSRIGRWPSAQPWDQSGVEDARLPALRP